MTNGKARNRRVNNFWEPMHDPSFKEKYGIFKREEWEPTTNKGPSQTTFSEDNLLKSGSKRFDSITFSECDFTGDFGKSDTIIFNECEFILCDFGTSTFNNVKFTMCKFQQTSFTQTRFNNCQLRSCIYDRIGISGNETQLNSTEIDNPSEFIKAAYTNTKQLPANVSASYQLLRLSLTRATVARVILDNLAREGSEESYYDAVKASTLAGCRAGMAQALLSTPRFDKIDREASIFSKVKIPVQYARGYLQWGASAVEFVVLYLFGLSNGWGNSISRLILLSVISAAFFAFCYKITENLDFSNSILKSIEIFYAFGYTKHSLLNENIDMNILHISNALLGVFWYAVFISTVISKITRVR